MGPRNTHRVTEVFRAWVCDLVRMFFPERRNRRLSDDERVRIASRLLDISEFRFFQISYSRWYGSEISERETEPAFSAYMMNDLVPHWVRHFAREVLSRYLQGVLDPGEYNIQCRIPPYGIQESRSFLPVFLTIVYLIVFLFASGNIVVP